MNNDIIIVSHSKRIRKFIYNFFNNFNINKKFMNCAVLHLFNENNNVCLRLIYRGELDLSEKRNPNNYYEIDEFNNLNFKTNKLLIPNNINFYFIRHAQGYHNLAISIIQKIKYLDNKHILKDPQLTNLGKHQAKNVGLFLKNIIKNPICFCSVLLRTRETISIILNNMNFLNNEVYVLPGAHEIINIIIPEIFNINFDFCVGDIDRQLYKCDYITNNDNLDKFNWRYYLYIKKNKIKFTNMIYETYLAIAFYKYGEDYMNKLRNKLVK